MPRIRRKRKSRTSWADEHRAAVLSHDFFNLFADGDHEHRCWRDLKSELLPEWIAQHPGRRPRCWWLYDAPAEREYFGTEIKWTFGNGTPKEKRLPLTGAPQGYYGIRVPALESEERFLRRHSLLNDAELLALERTDEHGNGNN